MQTGNASDGASIRSDDRNSLGSFARSALHPLRNILPINIRYGFNATGYD